MIMAINHRAGNCGDVGNFDTVINFSFGGFRLKPRGPQKTMIEALRG
jgi:hypothetical protein